jgi:hypothetical protein
MFDKPITTAIHIELQKFADTLLRIQKSKGAAHISEDDAQRMRNALVRFYATHITRVIQEDEYPDVDGSMPEGAVLLAEFGVEPLMAKRLAAECSLEDIKGWIAYARKAKSLANPPGLVVARLQKGVPAPKVQSRQERYRDHLSGEYGQYIQH